MSKTVGEWFDLLLKDNKPARETLVEVARIATYAENAIWMLWRKHDPVSAVDLVRMREQKEKTGKWPKLPAYKLEKTPEGETPTKIAGALCPGLASCVYDAIANTVTKLYLKNRLTYLGFWERLPISRDLRIRFREKAVMLRRNPDNPHWFQIGLKLRSPQKGKTETLWMDIHTGGKSEHTIRWLNEVADGKAQPSGGVVSAKRRKGKLRWQVTQARARYEGERETTKPVAGRELICWAPLDQEQFMWMQVVPVRGRPWREPIESHDMLMLKLRDAKIRQSMGRNYHQSPASAAHGHGRRRAIRGKLAFTERYERRVKDWIENRSASIVAFAIETRCEGIRMEKLSDRDPSTLRLGSFPYFRLIERTRQKAADAGLSWAMFSDFEAVKKQLTAGIAEACGASGG